jgi:signal transduction histidine kinase
LEYFHQFVIFITLIIIMSLVVWRLSLALEKARVKGKQSAAFSRQMVLGREQERSRIARELHDSVAQELSALAMKVRDKELSEGLTGLIVRVRNICNDLAPPEFRHQGLADALRKLCYDFEKTAGLECRITVMDGFSPVPMPIDMQLQCFRLVQEALANIRKHAEASEVTVVLRNADYGGDKTKPGLLICVSDDGKGLPPMVLAEINREGAYAEEDHFGVRGMYERIAILEGSLSFISEEGEGTMVKIEAPLQTLMVASD